MADILQLNGISCAIDGKLIVDDISLTAGAGEIVCLLGPSGCGKSTSLRLIAGLELPCAGQVSIDGKTMWSEAVNIPPERRGVGYLFQEYALFPHLTVRENVAFGVSNLPRAEQVARVTSLLEQVGLSHLADSQTQILSGGEQQRVALARALAPAPKLMLLDEPFSSLDPQLRDDIRDMTAEVLRQSKTATVLVTHDADDALALADRLIVMMSGRVVQSGTPQAVYDAPASLDVARIFGQINQIFPADLTRLTKGAFAVPPEIKQLAVRPNHIHGGEPQEQGAVVFSAQVSVLRQIAGLYLCELDLGEGLRWRQVVSEQNVPPEGLQSFWIPRTRLMTFGA
jgi:iron(III) transport system ATP-binding protein